MKPIICAIASVAIAVSPASAGHCVKCVKRAPVVVKQQVVKELVPVVEQQNVVHYFVGAPAGLAYQPLQQAHYGQLQRQMERLMDRFADLGQLQQQQQAYAPYYAPPQQYVQPQQQMECPGAQQQQAPTCNGCEKCGKQQTEQLPPPDGGDQPRFSMKLGPGVVANTCVKCHNDDKASGDLSFEQPLTNEQKLKALANASNGTMPPKGEDLAPEQVRELAVELFGEEQGNQLSDVLNPPSQ